MVKMVEMLMTWQCVMNVKETGYYEAVIYTNREVDSNIIQ